MWTQPNARHAAARLQVVEEVGVMAEARRMRDEALAGYLTAAWRALGHFVSRQSHWYSPKSPARALMRLD